MATFFSATVFGSSLYLISWLFLIYSFLGVWVEGLFSAVCEGCLEARLGLLYVPLRPLYGVGGVICALLLHRFLAEPIMVFLLGMLICTVVEYLASLFTEKAFGAISWDYSDKVWHLHGRVCLQYSLGWGLLAMFVVYVLNPSLVHLVELFPRPYGDVLLAGAMIVAMATAVVTTAALARTRARISVLQAKTRGQAVADSRSPWDRLVDRVAPDSVVINSFPQMSLMAELAELTGGKRAEIRLPGYPGLLSARRRKVSQDGQRTRA